MSLSDALVATEWELADQLGQYRTALPSASNQAVAACCDLGERLGLEAAQAAQVCRTASVLLSFGRRALRRMTGQPAAAAQALHLIQEQNQAVSAVKTPGSHQLQMTRCLATNVATKAALKTCHLPPAACRNPSNPPLSYMCRCSN